MITNKNLSNVVRFKQNTEFFFNDESTNLCHFFETGVLVSYDFIFLITKVQKFKQNLGYHYEEVFFLKEIAVFSHGNVSVMDNQHFFNIKISSTYI